MHQSDFLLPMVTNSQLPHWLSEGKGQPHTRCQHSDQNTINTVHRHKALQQCVCVCVCVWERERVRERERERGWKSEWVRRERERERRMNVLKGKEESFHLHTSLDQYSLLLSPGWVALLPTYKPLPDQQLQCTKKKDWQSKARLPMQRHTNLLHFLGCSTQRYRGPPSVETTGEVFVFLSGPLGIHVLTTDTLNLLLGCGLVYYL